MAVRLLSSAASPIQPAERPRRLLYLVHQFYPEYRNGTEKFVLQLAQSMQARGHQVQVMTYGLQRMRRFWRWLGVKLLQQRYTYRGVPVLALRHTNRPPRYYHQLEDEIQRAFARQFLRRWCPDLVHVGHAMRMSGFVWAAHDLGIPTIMTLTDYWLLCPKTILVNSRGALCDGPAQGLACRSDCPDLSPDFVSRRLALAETLVRQAACVLAPSRHLGQLFQREWPWLALQVVPHGGQPWIHNGRCYARGDGLVFAYAGSLTRHKGVHTLIEAFCRVEAATARLEIHGTGPDETSLRALAASDPRIRFCGVYAEQAASQVFGTMDVLVAPSEWSENRPFVVYEALAAGVPVIVSAVGGMVEAVEDGVTGFVTPPGDVAALRATLQRLVDAPEELNGVKERIAGLAIPSPGREADAYATIYQNIM